MISCRIGIGLSPEVDLKVNGEPLTFVLDTGFAGEIELAIQEDHLIALGATYVGDADVAFANGTFESLKLYSLQVQWGGIERDCNACGIKVKRDSAAKHAPANLLGMRMLENCQLFLDVRQNGSGTISTLN